MKLRKYLNWTAVVCLLCGPLIPAFGINNDDVVTMFKAGLAEETIVVAIRHEEAHDFDTSPMALVGLKEAGLSDAIIQAMIDPAGELVPSKPALTLFKDVPADEVMPPVIAPVVGNPYYTRINFWYEKDRSIATNYSRGILVPINTPVELVKVKSKEFSIRLESGAVVRIANEPDYTKADVAELMTRYLAAEPTKIELYGDEVAPLISGGVVRLGMTKDQVLLARGYPPFHETVSLDADRWTYWSSRFVKQTLVFADGRLVEGRGLE